MKTSLENYLGEIEYKGVPVPYHIECVVGTLGQVYKASGFFYLGQSKFHLSYVRSYGRAAEYNDLTAPNGINYELKRGVDHFALFHDYPIVMGVAPDYYSILEKSIIHAISDIAYKQNRKTDLGESVTVDFIHEHLSHYRFYDYSPCIIVGPGFGAGGGAFCYECSEFWEEQFYSFALDCTGRFRCPSCIGREEFFKFMSQFKYAIKKDKQ